MDNTKRSRVYDIFESISTDYDKANTRISLGMEKGWKRMLTDRLCKLPAGANILDVCCGTGDIALETAQRRPDVQVTGVDFSPAMLHEAEQKRGELGNVRFLLGDAIDLPFADNSFDAVCISFGLRNTADYETVLRQLHRVAKPGASVYCLDSFVPESAIIKPFYRIYFRFLMPRIGGGKKHIQQYKWLYESTQTFLRPQQLEQLYRTVGLTNLRTQRKLFGACVLVMGEK